MGEHDETAPIHHWARDPVIEPVPIVGKATGVPIVDQGTLCKRAPGATGCFLDPADRAILLVALNTVVGSALGNFRDAIHNVRLELLTITESSSGWGFLAEVLFQSLSGGLIGLFGKALSGIRVALDTGKIARIGGLAVPGELAAQLVKHDPKKLTGVLIQASKGIRTQLKNAAHGPAHASGEHQEQAAFLKVIQDGLGPLTNHLVLEAPVTLDDHELALMVGAFQDPDVYSTSAIEAELRDLCRRFSEQQIGAIGDGVVDVDHHTSRKQAVHVFAPGKPSRICLLEFFDPRIEGLALSKVGLGDSAPAAQVVSRGYDHGVGPSERVAFATWVDEDLAGAAIEYQYDRAGGMAVIDASAATGLAQIDQWAKTP